MKRAWDIIEDRIIVGSANTYRERGLKSKEALDLAFDELQAAGWNDRTRGAMEARYYTLMKKPELLERTQPAPAAYEEPVTEAVAQTEKETSMQVLKADDLIGSLDVFKNTLLAIKDENAAIIAENAELKAQLADALAAAEGHEELKQNYTFLMRVIEEARRSVTMDEVEKTGAKYKMERNGNLERIS